MYVRLVVIFCSKERVIRPKEAHVDYTKKEFWGIGDAPKQLGHNEVIYNDAQLANARGFWKFTLIKKG